MNKAKEALDTFNVDKVTWSAYDYQAWANINGQTIRKALELLDRVENGGDSWSSPVHFLGDDPYVDTGKTTQALIELTKNYILIKKDDK